MIVKQKARFMSHIFEYSGDLDLTKFTATTDSQDSQSQENTQTNNDELQAENHINIVGA